MVVEIMQYINETVKLTKFEAEAIYGGIMIDTNNFTNRTGVRTFEAAAYLKKNGADITKVRRMFRDDISDYKAKATAIQNTEIYLEEYAISVCRAEHVSSPTVVGAQAANELLNVKNVKASFVCTPYNDQIYISARSIDKVNVQLIMEAFGGGGHMNLAGAQVKDKSVNEVIMTLKKIINQRLEEGEI
jgi:c-di-AMP phosphodiesterase-like protein